MLLSFPLWFLPVFGAEGDWSYSAQDKWEPAVCQNGQVQSPVNLWTNLTMPPEDDKTQLSSSTTVRPVVTPALDVSLVGKTQPAPLDVSLVGKTQAAPLDAGLATKDPKTQFHGQPTGTDFSWNPARLDGSLIFDVSKHLITHFKGGAEFSSNRPIMNFRWPQYGQGFQGPLASQTFATKGGHIHRPSEHTVDGKYYDAELHLVHTTPEGRVLVVGVFLEASDELEADSCLITQIHSKKLGHGAKLVHLLKPVLKSEYATFEGSFTTPPCTEGVTWVVLRTPLPVRRSALDWVSPANQPTNRKIQPLNTRVPRYSTAQKDLDMYTQWVQGSKTSPA